MENDPSLGGPREGRVREPTQDLDTVFALLAHPYRQHVLVTLLDAGGPCDLDELVNAVVTRDPELTAADRKEVHVALHHVHLPKLAAASVIDYEDDAVRPVDLSSVGWVLTRTGLYGSGTA